MELKDNPTLTDANWFVVKKIAVNVIDKDVHLANISRKVCPPPPPAEHAWQRRAAQGMA